MCKYVNKTLCDKSGWSFKEITDPSFNILEKMIHHDFHAKITEMMKRRLKGESPVKNNQ